MLLNNFTENISITGITPLEYYPRCKDITHNKQNMQNADICIPCEKPDMESIEEIKVSICDIKSKPIDTILGPKIILNGIVKIKIIYTADNCEQSLHSAHWDIPFYDFILLDDLCNNYDLDWLDLFVGLEDICLNCYNSRHINLSILYIICIIFDKIQQNCDCNRKCIKDNAHKNNSSSDYKNSKKINHNTYYYSVEHY